MLKQKLRENICTINLRPIQLLLTQPVHFLSSVERMASLLPPLLLEASSPFSMFELSSFINCTSPLSINHSLINGFSVLKVYSFFILISLLLRSSRSNLPRTQTLICIFA